MPDYTLIYDEQFDDEYYSHLYELHKQEQRLREPGAMEEIPEDYELRLNQSLVAAEN